jgi:hypothetical protein
MQENRKQPRLRLVEKTATKGYGEAEFMVMTGSVTVLMNEICQLISHITGASMVVVTRAGQGAKVMKVIGRVGTLATELNFQEVLSELKPGAAPMLLSADVRSDSRFQGSQQLEQMPHVKSLIATLVPTAETQATTLLYIANPRKSVLQDGTIMQVLSDICVIIRDLLSLRSSYASELEELRNSIGEESQPLGNRNQFAEAASMHSLQADARAAATFLFETLVRRRGLHSRKGADYVSLRAWRLPLKKYQISALTAIKESPSHEFVLRVADELAAYVRQAHGERVIRSVVPVPPGSSGKPESLSTMVAEAVAKLLGADYSNVLEPLGPVPPGKSTPRKSAQLMGYRLLKPLDGPVLVVDDVASSGRHIELAISACKSPSTAVYALAWISK